MARTCGRRISDPALLMVQLTRALVQFSLEWRKGLRPGIEWIAFAQNQQSAIAIAAQKDEAESGDAFSLPTLSSESLHGQSHRAAQVGGGFEPLGFDDFPLQVKENDIPRRLSTGVEVVVISGHRGSFTSDSSRVHSVLASARYCIRMPAPTGREEPNIDSSCSVEPASVSWMHELL
jgi:hypothetical protein